MRFTPSRLAVRALWASAFAALGIIAQLGSDLYRNARGEPAAGWARHLLVPSFAAAVDRLTLDAGLRLRRSAAPLAPVDDPVVVGIDQAYLDRVKVPLAISQHALGTILANIAAQHPRVIVVDLVLPDRRFSQVVAVEGSADAPEIALARGLRAAGRDSRIVLARTWDPIRREFRAILPEFALAADVRGLLAGRPRAENVLGSALHCPDEDGVVRAFPGAWCQPIAHATMAELASGAAGAASPGLVNFLLGPAFDYLPAARFLDPQAAAGAPIRGRPVFVGSVLPFEDRIGAPVPLAAWPQETAGEPGVLLQAQMLRTLLGGGPVPALAPGWIALLLAAIAAPLLLPRWEWACAGVAGVFAATVLTAHAQLAAALWIPLGGATLVALLSILQPMVSHAIRSGEEKRWLLRVFGGYVSPRVMKRIVAGGRGLLDAPEKKDISVLFVDIRDFTPLCESLPPQQVISTLADYRDAFVNAVHDAGGTVTSFTGDGLMAIYGAPDEMPNHAEAAVASAVDMVARVRHIAEAAVERGGKGLRIGVGVNCGPAVVGLMKASSRHEYGALGDVVNVAARLEALTKECGFPIVISAAVQERASTRVDARDLGTRSIKGHHPVHVFGIGTRTKARDPGTPSGLQFDKTGVHTQD
jgi:class 3 adenylate cyclase